MSKRESGGSGALQVARVAGIPISLHFTFLLFIIYVSVVAQKLGKMQLLALVPAVFLCVLLHELGHALVAQRFGIQTRMITLYLIGGVAYIDGRPKPKEEFWIAIAGPLVNIGIAIILLPIVLLVDKQLPSSSINFSQGPFFSGLLMANIMIPLFNLIPALPMDGGRVFRSLLAMRIGETRATRIAASVGQILALGFVVYGFTAGNIFLLLIAFFVWMGAGQEVANTEGYSLVSGRKVSDAMMTEFHVIGSNETLGKAAQMLLQSPQHDFPVTWGDDVLGLLTHESIIQGITMNGADEYVAGHMQRDFRRLSPSDPLENALEVFSMQDRSPILVMEDERLAGILSVQSLAEFMMLEKARHAS